jgi:Na+/glutamate symporter
VVIGVGVAIATAAGVDGLIGLLGAAIALLGLGVARALGDLYAENAQQWRALAETSALAQTVRTRREDVGEQADP